MILALALAFGMVGWALEVAHPVFFAREPVVVWTFPGEPNPKLFLHDTLWPAAWSCYEEEGRLRWEADLRDAPLGIWIVLAKTVSHSSGYLRTTGLWKCTMRLLDSK